MKSFGLPVAARDLVVVASLLLVTQASAQTVHLRSDECAATKAIVPFVQSTTSREIWKFVPPAECIPTFNQDGTLGVSPS